MDELILKQRRLLSNLKFSFSRGLVEDIAWDERLIGIQGARGVGKTTLLLQHIKEKYSNRNDCLYLSMDDISFPYNSLVDLAEDFYNKGGKKLFVDEIHKYPNWSQELKNIYDSYPDIHVVFTGSSILHIHGGKADLSRRAVVYKMQGLSFREFLQIETGLKFPKYKLDEILKNHEAIALMVIEKVKPLVYFQNYLKFGYYPYYLQGKNTYSIKLSATIGLTIEADIPYLLNMEMKYINKLKRFLYVLSTNVPFKPNITQLAQSIEMSRQTTLTYLRYLKDAEIISMIYAKGKGYGTLSKPEKIYLYHPNLNYALAEENTNIGNLRESFFLNQLSYLYNIEAAATGDFFVNNEYTFEVGGKNKSFTQIKKVKNSYIAADDLESGIGNKIPLWLFGFLY
jgi:predicted AAA+ superfamily ATPase